MCVTDALTFYIHFSELCVIVSGHGSDGTCSWGPLMTQPWGQAAQTALLEGHSWMMREAWARLCPAFSWHSRREQNFYWTLSDRCRMWVKGTLLGLISHKMDSTYYTASTSPLIYCLVRLAFSERGEGGKIRNCSLSQGFFYCRCLQLALSAFLSLWVHKNSLHNYVFVLITFLLLN